MHVMYLPLALRLSKLAAEPCDVDVVAGGKPDDQSSICGHLSLLITNLSGAYLTSIRSLIVHQDVDVAYLILTDAGCQRPVLSHGKTWTDSSPWAGGTTTAATVRVSDLS